MPRISTRRLWICTPIYRTRIRTCSSVTDRGKISAEEAARLYKTIQPIMDLLRQARKAGYADWNMGPLTFNTPLPHLTKVQDLSMVAYWDAGYRFGIDPDGAVADLAAREAMGRSLDNVGIGFLVDVGISFSGLKLLAENGGSISPASSNDAAYLTDPSGDEAAFAAQ